MNSSSPARLLGRRRMLPDNLQINGRSHTSDLVHLSRDYVHYYHSNRTHDGSGKDTPQGRRIENKPDNGAEAYHSHGSAVFIIAMAGGVLSLV